MSDTERRRPRRAARARSLAGRLSSATRCSSSGACVILSSGSSAGHVPDDGELLDDLRLAGDTRRADAGAAVPLTAATTTSPSRRRWALVGDDARDPERQPRLVDRARRSLAALGVGLLVGLINGAIIVLLGIDSLIVDARHVDVHRRRDPLDQQLADDQRRLDSAGRRVVVDSSLGIPLAFYYGIALGLIMLYVFEFMPSAGGCSSSVAAAVSPG